MALFLHHMGGKRMNVLIAVWNKFTLVWNKLKIFARGGFLYGSIVLSPCIENQPQNGFQETRVCAYVSVHIYAYILPRNYVWVCVCIHTHFREHWEWFLRSTWGLVTCPAWVCLVAYLPPCPLTQRKPQKCSWKQDRGWGGVDGTAREMLGMLRIKDSPSLIAQLVKNPPAMQETLVRFLGWEDLLEKGKATHSSIVGLPLWLSW